jgi:hypothetical protein
MRNSQIKKNRVFEGAETLFQKVSAKKTTSTRKINRKLISHKNSTLLAIGRIFT